MCPSTDSVSAEHPFAVKVLQDLLTRIERSNEEAGYGRYLVSHAWTAGAMLHVVYQAPPSNRAWGLARDTTQAIINSGPWGPHDDPALLYYLIDFEENQPSSSFRPPDEPDIIWWFGHPRDGLPHHLSDIADDKRYVPVRSNPPEGETLPLSESEPRRYGSRT